MGDSISWEVGLVLQIDAENLKQGDILKVITKTTNDVLFQAATDGEVRLDYPVVSPGFVRVEIQRAFLPGLPFLPALISNPIYFDTP